MEQSKVKKITAGLIFSWVVGVMLLILAMPLFMWKVWFAGVVVLVCSLLIIPYFNNLIAEKLHVEISGGLKVIIAIIGFIVYFSAISSAAFSPFKGDKNSGGKVITNNQQATTSAVAVNSGTEISPVVGCPNVVKEASKYEFKYADSTAGEKNLWLAPSFILEMKFSDGFELYNKPDMGNEYIYNSEEFLCEIGSQTGQSTNKLYCRGTFMYEPSLRKKVIDKDGNVISTDDKDIDKFIFDITGKDITTVNDLNSLKLESMTCK